MRVYACMHVYSQIRYKHSKYWESLHSHTGTVAQFTSLNQRDGVQDLKTSKVFCMLLNIFLDAGCTGVFPSAGRLSLPLLLGKNI